MTEGRVNIIDATPVEVAQSGPGNGVDGKPTKDAEAGWHVKQDSRGQLKSTYGYSVHTGVDEDGFIHRQTVTPGNVHDSRERDTLLLGDESQLYADAAYSSAETRNKLARFGVQDRVQRKGYRNCPLPVSDQERNKEIAVTRSGRERPFATYKRLYGLARTRYIGLERNLTFYGLAMVWRQLPAISARGLNSSRYMVFENWFPQDKRAQILENSQNSQSKSPNNRLGKSENYKIS